MVAVLAGGANVPNHGTVPMRSGQRMGGACRAPTQLACLAGRVGDPRGAHLYLLGLGLEAGDGLLAVPQPPAEPLLLLSSLSQGVLEPQLHLGQAVCLLLYLQVQLCQPGPRLLRLPLQLGQPLLQLGVLLAPGQHSRGCVIQGHLPPCCHRRRVQLLTWRWAQPWHGACCCRRSSRSSPSQAFISCRRRSFSAASRSRCFSASVPPCQPQRVGAGHAPSCRDAPQPAAPWGAPAHRARGVPLCPASSHSAVLGISH